jgi:Transcriptional Coactivator p15 (PC4)
MTDKKMADPKASQNNTLSNVNTAANAGTVFLDLRKSDTEHLRIAVREHRGRMFIDIRNWFVGGDQAWHPSDKGVTLRPDQVPEIVRGLMLAGQAFDPKGGA